MKKINMLTIGLMISISSFAQQISFNKLANVSLPKGVQKVDEAQSLSHSKRLFKHTSMGALKTKNLYTIGDISIALWDLSNPNDKRSLEDIKNETLGLLKLDKNIIVNSAVIKKINNTNFFIFNDQQNGDVNYYQFISEPRNNKTLNGLIEYKNSDKDKAKAILDDVLKSVKFKE